MNILHIIETISSRYGGPVSVVKELSNIQNKLGHNVTICTTNCDFPKGKLRDAGIDYLHDTKVKVLYFPVQFRPLKVSFPMAIFLIKNIQNFHLVHIHGLYRFPSTFAAKIAHHKKVPYIILPFGSLNKYSFYNSSYNITIKRLYERLFDLPNLKKANAIQYTTEEERFQASGLNFKNYSFIVPNGIDWNKFAVLPQRGFLRSYLGLSKREKIILFVGRITQVKGIDLLIPAFEKIKKYKNNIHLVLIGPENDDYGKKIFNSILNKNITDSVHHIGHLERNDLIKAYVDADIFVLPSYSESFGMTAVEAMACGIPTIISNQVNIYPEVVNEKAGLVVPCDENALSKAIIDFLENPQKRKTIGKNGREFVYKKYTWDKLAIKLFEEYEKIINFS